MKFIEFCEGVIAVVMIAAMFLGSAILLWGIVELIGWGFTLGLAAGGFMTMAIFWSVLWELSRRR